MVTQKWANFEILIIYSLYQKYLVSIYCYFIEFDEPAFQHNQPLPRAIKKVHVRYLICSWASCLSLLTTSVAIESPSVQHRSRIRIFRILFILKI